MKKRSSMGSVVAASVSAASPRRPDAAITMGASQSRNQEVSSRPLMNGVLPPHRHPGDDGQEGEGTGRRQRAPEPAAHQADAAALLAALGRAMADLAAERNGTGV